MAVRPIDGNKLIEWFSPYLHTGEPIPADVVIEDIRSMPTLTPPNEWVSVEERCKELEERCKRLNEARERANEAAAKWESMYRVALERAEREEIARKQGKVMVCPVCQGRGRVHTSFYGYGNCLMEDVRNDKFPPVCHCCRGKGILQVNEMNEEYGVSEE